MEPKSTAVKKMIVHPYNNKRLSLVISGGQWYGWNSAYHVYNGQKDYRQLQATDKIEFDPRAWNDFHFAKS